MSEPSCFICDTGLVVAPYNLSSLTCGHVFHETCIETWNTLSNNCPICKEYIDGDYNNVIPLLLNKEQSKMGEKNTSASLDHVLKNTKQFQRNIDASKDSLEKLRIPHSNYKELRYFFKGD